MVIDRPSVVTRAGDTMRGGTQRRCFQSTGFRTFAQAGVRFDFCDSLLLRKKDRLKRLLDNIFQQSHLVPVEHEEHSSFPVEIDLDLIALA